MKKSLFVLGLILVALGLVSCSGTGIYKRNAGKTVKQDAMYMDISAEKAYMMMLDMPEMIVVDVSPIYDRGHIPGAISAFVGDGTLDEMLKMWNKESIYLVYCHSDEASMLGAQKLVDAGFKNVYRLKGNYKAWVEAGYPVEM